MDNRQGAELKRRVARAWQVFGTVSDRVRCSKASLKLRIQLIDVHVLPALLWGAGSWNLTVVQLAKLRGVQRKMVRAALGIPRRPEEKVDEYSWRVQSAVNRAIERYSTPWDIKYHQKLFGTAGHLARLAKYDPGRVSGRILFFKNLNWIYDQQKKFGSQRHCRRFRVWRWERPIHRFLGPNWTQLALEKEAWNAQLPAYLAWRRVNR